MTGILLTLLALIILVNFWPRLVFMATHRRVRVEIQNKNGGTESLTLFLKENDPIWRAVQRHRSKL